MSKLGVLLFVMLSDDEFPVSEAAWRSGAIGVPGSVVSTTTMPSIERR